MANAKTIWTTRDLLTWTTQRFEKAEIDSPRVAAEMLLSKVLETERLRLYMEPDRPASEIERSTFRSLVERALKHEPVDYLVGESPFFNLTLKVDQRVLIPRPSTETAVEHVLQHARRTPGFTTGPLLIADVCTGSGAIALAIAKHLDRASFIATDISDDALAVAQANAASLGLEDRVTFRQGDLLEPIQRERGRFHYLISNPPYIPDNEWPDVAPNVKDHEPTLALRGGEDGLDQIRPIIDGASELLQSPGQVVIEVAAVHQKPVIQLAEEAGLQHPHVLPDHERLPRVLVANKD